MIFNDIMKSVHKILKNGTVYIFEVLFNLLVLFFPVISLFLYPILSFYSLLAGHTSLVPFIHSILATGIHLFIDIL